MKELFREFNSTDRAVYLLRKLYGGYGFKQYRMSKFEEYDLYVKNKDFLMSENVITFTDTDGKLMALKPDVTLSIIKNGTSGANVEKVYYNENVYRVSKGTNSFKEFMQVGLECFGNIDEYAISEVVYLAVKSLETVADEYILDVSSLSVVKGIINFAGLSELGAKKVINCLSEKNAHGVLSVCKEENVPQEKAQILKKLVTTYGEPKSVIAQLKNLEVGGIIDKPIKELEQLINSLISLGVGDKIRIDFSVVSNMNYYNGIVFKGFVSGIPTSIISGGQYDNLMKKMKRTDRAIGFAVYLDELEKLCAKDTGFDVDVAVLYQVGQDVTLINKTVKEITDNGETVFVASSIPENLKYKRKVEIEGGNKR